VLIALVVAVADVLADRRHPDEPDGHHVHTHEAGAGAHRSAT
jgi:hypothetical protein